MRRRWSLRFLAVLLWTTAGTIGCFGLLLVGFGVYDLASTPAGACGTTVYASLIFGLIGASIALGLHLLARSAHRQAAAT